MRVAIVTTGGTIAKTYDEADGRLKNERSVIDTRVQALRLPILLTGAMRPWEFRDSDAEQNVTEALLAATLVAPGVYAVMHGRVLPFPGVTKDREALTFVRRETG